MKNKKIAALEKKVEEQQRVLELMKDCFIALGVNPSVFEEVRKQS